MRGLSSLALLTAMLSGLTAAPARAGGCNPFLPGSPAPSGVITLGAAERFDEVDGQLRSFVETGSLGPVAVRVVGAAPRAAILAVTAHPAVSRFSRYYGEQLRGIDVVVALAPGFHTARVRVRLSQVCARHFHDTFLYY